MCVCVCVEEGQDTSHCPQADDWTNDRVFSSCVEACSHYLQQVTTTAEVTPQACMHTQHVTATEHAHTDRGMDKVGGGGPPPGDGGHRDLVALDGLRGRLHVL